MRNNREESSFRSTCNKATRLCLISCQTGIATAVFEHGSQPAQLKQISDPRLQVRQIQLTFRSRSRQIDTNKRTDARAVYVVNSCHVEHNPLGIGYKAPDRALQ